MVLTDYRVKGVPADMTETAFSAVLQAAGSPVRVEEALKVYRYAVGRKLSPAFLLAMFHHESGYGRAGTATQTHSWGNTRPPSYGVPQIGTVPGRSGIFSVYANWADGGISTAARFFDHLAYAAAFTVRQIIPIWAPSSDGNDTERYIAAVLTDIEQWTGASNMGHVPKPPITSHIVTLPPRKDGVGLNVNTWNRVPHGTVLHSMGGSLAGCDGYFWSANCPALTDFGIGQGNYQGSGFAQIIQWCDFRGKIEPWASGPVRKPEGDGQAFLDTFGGPGKLNEAGISIEHDDTTRADGQSSGQPGSQPVSVYQWSASCWLQAWLHAEVLGQTADTFAWNMYHYEFCGRDYKTCPNPRITNYTAEHQAATMAIMRHFQEGVPYPDGGVTVAGQRLNLPGGGTQEGEVREPAPGEFAAYQNAKGETIFVWNASGKATRTVGIAAIDLGVSVENDGGEKYDRSIQNNVVQQWQGPR